VCSQEETFLDIQVKNQPTTKMSKILKYTKWYNKNNSMDYWSLVAKNLSHPRCAQELDLT